jgi:hypothetical protein
MLRLLVDVVVDSVREAGPEGAPGGVLYAALMTQGCTYQQFESLVSGLVSVGKLTRRGHCYFAGAGK